MVVVYLIAGAALMGLLLGVGIGIPFSHGPGTGGGGGGPTLDPSLATPTLALGTAYNSYPPVFDATFPGGMHTGDQIEFVRSTTLAGLMALTSGTKVDDDDDNGAATMPGLAGISSGATYARCRMAVGSTYGNWSNVCVHGVTAPAFTSSTTLTNPEDQFLAKTVTSNATTPVYTIVGGADAALVEFNPAGTLRWAGGIKRPYSPAGDANGDNVYEITLRVTDTTTTLYTDTAFTITNQFVVQTTWDPSFKKDGAITLSNGNLTFIGNGPGIGQDVGVRSTTSRSSGKLYLQALISTVPSGNVVGLGVTNGAFTDDLAGVEGYHLPSEGPYGLMHLILPGYTAIQGLNGADTGDRSAAFPGLITNPSGRRMGFAVDLGAARKYWPMVDGVFDGDPVAGTGGYTLPTGAIWIYGSSKDQPGLTLEPTATTYLPSGFSVWGN